MLFSFGIIATSATAQEPLSTRKNFEDHKVYSPYAGRDYPDEALFGDTHFHTNLSFDAGLAGEIEGMRMACRVYPGSLCPWAADTPWARDPVRQASCHCSAVANPEHDDSAVPDSLGRFVVNQLLRFSP